MMVLQVFRSVLLAAVLWFTCSAAGLAADIFWNSAVSGDWDDATKWAGGVVPGAGDDVFIDIDGTYTVTLDAANVSINSLTLGAAAGTQTLEILFRTLTLDAASEVSANGLLQLRSSTVNGAGLLDLKGSTRILQTSTIVNPTRNFAAGRVTVEGSTIGDAELRVDGVFDNRGRIHLTGSDAVNGRAARLSVRTSDLLINATGASILVSPGIIPGTRQITINSSGELRNFGTIEVAQALVLSPQANATFDNRGTLNVTGANLSSNQASNAEFINSGTCNVGATRSLNISSGDVVQQSGTWSGDGLLTLSFNDINGTSSFDPDLDCVLRSCTFDVALENSQQMDLSNTSTFNQPIMNATGAVIQVLGGNNGDAELRLQSRMDNFGLMRLINEHPTSGRTQTLRLNNASAHFVNATGAEVQVLNGTVAGTRQIIINTDARFENFAVINGDNDFVIDNNTDGDFLNAGTLNATAANITLQNNSSAEFFNVGTVNVSTGRQVLWSSGRFEQQGGNILGDGLVIFDFGTLNGTTQFTNQTMTRLRGVTVNADFVNQSTAFVRNTCTFNALFENQAAGTIKVEGSTVGDAELRIDDRGRNEGNIIITNTDGVTARTARLRVRPNDRFTNATNAAISLRAGTVAGTRELTVDDSGDFFNFGSISNDTGYRIDLNNGVFDNRSDITLTSATVALALTANAVFTNAGVIAVSTGLTLSVDNGTLGSDGGEISGGGLLSLISSTIEGDAMFTKINTNMRFGTINVDIFNRGRFTMFGLINLNGNLENGTNATLEIFGSNDGGDGNLQMNGTLKNFGVINLSNAHTLSARTSQIQINAGNSLLNCTGANIRLLTGTFGGSRRINPQPNALFRNFGTVGGEESMEITNNNGIIDNRATFNVTSANLVVFQSGVSSRMENSGVINIQPGQTMTVNSREFRHSGGTIVGGGLAELISLSLEGSVPFICQTPTLLRSSFVELPFENQSLVTIRNTVTFEELLTNTTGATIDIAGSASGSAQLTANATFANFGLVDLFGEASPSAQNSSLRVAIEMVNQPGATLATRRGANEGLRRVFISGAALFVNRGDILPSTQLTIFNQSGTFENAGKITLTNANLDLSQTFQSEFDFGGQLQTSTQATFFVQDGTTTITGATITGSGLIELHQGDIESAVPFNNQGRMIMRDIDFNTGLINSAMLSVRGNTEFNGFVTNANAGAIAIEGSSIDLNANMRIATGLLNDGVIELDNLDNTIDRSATLRVENDILATNSTTGSIAALASFGGDRTIELRNSNSRLQSFGDISAVSGATLTFDGGIATIATGATLSGFGTFDFSQGVVLEMFGTINPGASPGSFNVQGRFELEPTVVYKAEIGGTTAGDDYDQFSVSDGQLVFDGILDIDLIDGFIPRPGDQFTVVEYDDFTGTFSDIRDTDLASGLLLVPDYRSDKLVLFVADETALNIDVYMHGLWDGSKHKRSAAIVELREGADLSSSLLTTRKSALIDSTARLSADFGDVQTGDYWVIVRHGGNFAVASATRVTITQGEINDVDFTDKANVFNGITGMTTVTLGGNEYDVVRTGDFNSDLSVSADDFIQLFIPNFGIVNPGQVPLLD